MSDALWQPYLKNRLIKKIDSLRLCVIKPDSDEQIVPLCCPVCDRMMTSMLDAETWNRFTCCESCANVWAYKNSERWLAGWRPTKQEIERKLTSHDSI